MVQKKYNKQYWYIHFTYILSKRLQGIDKKKHVTKSPISFMKMRLSRSLLRHKRSQSRGLTFSNLYITLTDLEDYDMWQ